ncbi:penicillin-binding protein 2 [Oscillatoria sp. FACHB-1407]|uniref:peptidoglycan D,D-transpeptidase FtsI family protein n=1 Tax=Oscillatoria sp. FACHB-1407 TaxID=2692847 RepID=UPI001683B2D8|nr:penicillin-binding protein 2 [Oscillatoria sp. FACHB-1407]MBD2464692.1 penicillin-binding protein 2 [Oscillatoria sp. FACHB-1407]
MATVPPSNSPYTSRTKRAQQRSLRRTAKRFPQRGNLSLLPTRPGQSPVQPSRLRLLVVWGILILGGLGLLLNLVGLQIVKAPGLQERAQQQQIVSLQPFTARRPIVDRLGNVLAIDQPVYTLYAHPMLFKQSKEEIANALAPLLKRTSAQLFSQLSQGNSGIRLEFALSQDAANQVKALQMDGLELVQHPQRLYPQEDLFADVVGYVDVDRQGQAGIEFSQQPLLEKSTSESIELSRTGNGALIPSQLPEGFVQQDDLRLQLTLDSRLQRTARHALKQQMEQFGAKRGAVLVMDVRDGGMRSLVVEPSYNPNEYYRFNVDRFRNWAVSDLLEPGSTFKPINVAIALDARAIRPNDVINDEGTLQFGEWTIENYDYDERGGRGAQTITEILQHSSNVGMVHITERLRPNVYYSRLEDLGLGQKTGIDLPFESSSQMKPYDQFMNAAVERATTAFGQGFSLTPVQLLQLHAAIANGGRLVKPHIVEGLFHADGQPEWQPNEPDPPQVFSPQTSQTVLTMMESVVTEGTGQSAQIPGYRVAGKTGTAQKASPDGGYLDHARITSFVSVLPVEAPRYAVLVVIDEPRGDDAYGSTVSAPIAKSVMESLITLERIPPSQPLTDDLTEESEMSF